MRSERVNIVCSVAQSFDGCPEVTPSLRLRAEIDLLRDESKSKPFQRIITKHL